MRVHKNFLCNISNSALCEIQIKYQIRKSPREFDEGYLNEDES